MNSKRPEHDSAQETKGDHHSQHIEFQRQTHGVTSELLHFAKLPESGQPCKMKTSLQCSKSSNY
jgi:hypothetical protein